VKYFGLAAIRAEIDRAIDHAVLAEALVRKQPLLEVMSPAQLGVVCFRVHPAGRDDAADLDAFNERVNAAVSADGRYLISSTRLRGVFTLRLCILSYRTTAADVEGLIETVVACARRLGA
jgi:aromatic-L-amino-acid decarboxylase